MGCEFSNGVLVVVVTSCDDCMEYVLDGIEIGDRVVFNDCDTCDNCEVGDADSVMCDRVTCVVIGVLCDNVPSDGVGLL